MNKKIITFVNIGFVLSIILLCIFSSFKSEESSAVLLGFSVSRILLLLAAIIVELFIAWFGYLINYQWNKADIYIRKVLNDKKIFSALLFILVNLFIGFNAGLYHYINAQIIPKYLVIQILPIWGLILVVFIELIVISIYWKSKEVGGLEKVYLEIDFGLIAKFLLFFLILFSIYHIIKVIITITMRIAYPFQLEWMEGQSLIQVNRILKGFPLYARPSIYYIPLLYTPFYFYLSAIFSLFLGDGFLALRIVSLISTILISYLLMLITFRYSSNKLLSILSVGFFFSTFMVGGAWFDIARVDMLFIALLLLGFYFGLTTRPDRNVFCGLFFCLSVMTKQSIVITVMMIFCFYFFEDRKKFFYTIVPFVLFTSIFVGFEILKSGEWFNYYVLNQVSEHIMSMLEKTFSSIIYLIDKIPILFLLSALFFAIILRKKEIKKYSQVILLVCGFFVLFASFFNELWLLEKRYHTILYL